MGYAADLVAAGYGGYAGWGDQEALADFNAGHGDGKRTSGGGGGSSAGGDGGGGASVPPPFSFDYEGEAKKAYGELGAYYTRLLTWAQGDMNKVLTRLTEDYDRGLRVQTENTNTAKSKIEQNQAQADLAQQRSLETTKDNALARGLYQKSLFDESSNQNAPFSGFGIPDKNFAKVNDAFGFNTTQRQQQKTQLDTNLARYTEGANINKARVTADTKDAELRKEFNMEEERKLKAGDIANQRGSRAYQDYINKFSLT